MYKRNFIAYLILFLKGIAMGTANKVPGVSGGMVSMVAGFYEEFIYSLQKINLKSFRLLFNRGWSSFVDYTNLRFLSTVILGSVTAYFTISLVLDWFIKHYPILVWSFFFGMILGSIWYISKHVRHWNQHRYLTVALGASIGIVISFLPLIPENRNLIFIFLCGIISVSGMTLPGFSGSFLLIILGNYSLLLIDSVNNLTTVVFQLSSGLPITSDQTQLLIILAIFTLGSLLGMISLSSVIGHLLKNHHDRVISLLIGFIAGSLGAAWPWKLEDVNALTYTRYLNPFDIISVPHFLLSLFFILLGIILILFIQYAENKKVNLR